MVEIKESEIKNVGAWTYRTNEEECYITAYMTDKEMWFKLRDIYDAIHEPNMSAFDTIHKDEYAIIVFDNYDDSPRDTMAASVSGLYSILNHIGTDATSDLGRMISREVIPSAYHWTKSEDSDV